MSTFDSLDNTFDITPTDVTPADTTKALKKQKPPTVSLKSEDKEKDYQYVRGHLYNLAEKMQESLDGAMEVAQQSDHPRAYEVVFNGAKNVSEVVEKLSDLHKKMKDLEIEEVKVQAHQNNTQNNIYMTGSTADLMKMIKESQQDK